MEKEKTYEVLVIEGQLFFAGNVRKNLDGKITADVYKNIETYNAGIPMQLDGVFEYV